MKKIIKSEILLSDMIAIADDKGNKITYRELAGRAEALGRCLEAGSLVFCLCDRQRETVEFLYELLYAGGIPLLLEADINGEFLERLIRDYRPRYIYCRKSHEMGRRYPHEAEWENHALLKTGMERYPIHPDVALLLSTSGTTGSGKLVKISHENMADNVACGCARFGMHSGQKGLSPLPVNYAYGISFCFWHWYCGATWLVTELPVLGRDFREFYTRERVNNFAATPFTYQALQRVGFWDAERVESLNYAISAGAQLPEQTQTYLVDALKEKFWNGYGQTECFGVLTAMNFQDKKMKFGSVGRPFPNAEVTADRDTGEMLIRSRSVCMGYAGDREQLAEGDVNRGLLHTGDVIEIDGEGCIFLRGRLKRYVKILGKRVSLDDLANYLGDQYPDTEFACTGTDENIVIFHTGKGQEAEREIPALLDRRMKIPSRFVSCHYLERIPRNDSGKIAYGCLQCSR